MQALIFGGCTYFRCFERYDKAEWKILRGRSLFNSVLSVDNTLLCLFQRLCTYFLDKGYTFIWGYHVLSGHFSRQQISVKNEGYLFSEGYLFTGLYDIWIEACLFRWSLILSQGESPVCAFWNTSVNGKVLTLYSVWKCFCMNNQ